MSTEEVGTVLPPPLLHPEDEVVVSVPLHEVIN